MNASAGGGATIRGVRLSAWLVPAFVGPWVTITAYVSVDVFLLGETYPLFGGPLGNWVVGVIVGAIVACALGITFIVVDLFRWRLGLKPPERRRGWVLGLVSPLSAMCASSVWPSEHRWIDVVLPILLSAVVLRCVGHRASSSRSA